MKKMITVALSRLHNGEHFEFEKILLDALTPSVAAGLNLMAQRNQLNQLHRKEGEVYLTNRAYEQTEELTRLDDLRGKEFRYIRRTVKFYLTAGSKTQQSAADEVAFMLQPYRHSLKKNYQDSTAELGKFVLDMSAAPYPAHIATLGLTGTLAGLKAGNDAFQALYIARAKEGLSRAGHKSIRQLRQQFDEVYRIVAGVLPAMHFVETDAAKKAAIEKTIATINACILQLKKVLAIRTGKAEAADISVEKVEKEEKEEYKEEYKAKKEYKEIDKEEYKGEKEYKEIDKEEYKGEKDAEGGMQPAEAATWPAALLNSLAGWADPVDSRQAVLSQDDD
ncbi:MAG: DUF6261 family protein [Mediterranea sp.]|nr:DUF6261 family protein [Mediterranea sp.]